MMIHIPRNIFVLLHHSPWVCFVLNVSLCPGCFFPYLLGLFIEVLSFGSVALKYLHFPASASLRVQVCVSDTESWHGHVSWLHHSRAANHYVLVVVYYTQGHRTMLLCSWSYHYALPPKNFFFSISVVLVVPQPISVRILNQLTNHSVRFSSRSYASLPGETTSVFSHFKRPSWSEKQKASSWVINLVKKLHTKFSGKNISTEKSVQSAQHVKCMPASWNFYVTHGWMHDVERRINWKHHINKGKVIWSTLNISHFMVVRCRLHSIWTQFERRRFSDWFFL